MKIGWDIKPPWSLKTTKRQIMKTKLCDKKRLMQFTLFTAEQIILD